jgi:AcrR family transcriptional regulator
MMGHVVGSRPHDRLEQLAAAAMVMFERKGFAKTLMSDIAREMGVSQGLLYTYVESKEALLHLVVERIAADGRLDGHPLPVADPLPGTTVGLIMKLLQHGLAMPGLDDAARREAVDDPGAELAEIVRQLYAAVARWRHLLAIAERSALDLSGLHERFYAGGRRPLVARLAAYLQLRIATGAFRPVPDPAVAARLIIETVAWFAYHRHGDPDTAGIDERTAEETVVDMLVAALGCPAS